MQDPASELRRIPLPRTPVNRGKKEAVHNPDCRTRLLGVLGDLKNLVKRSLKIVTCAAKFIADSSLFALIPLVTGKYGWVRERPT
jgi:hypothetical protein